MKNWAGREGEKEETQAAMWRGRGGGGGGGERLCCGECSLHS